MTKDQRPYEMGYQNAQRGWGYCGEIYAAAEHRTAYADGWAAAKRDKEAA